MVVAAILIYVSLAFYTVFRGWPTNAAPRRVGLIWFLTLPTLTFVAFWLSGWGVWQILLFLIAGANTEPSFEDLATPISLLCAVFVSSVIFARMALGCATPRYFRISLFGNIALVAAFGAATGLEFLSNIDGSTAHEAAENFFASCPSPGPPFVNPDSPRRIVEEELPTDFLGPKEAKAFALYYGPIRIAEVRVAPYGWWWWTQISSKTWYPRSDIFTRARKLWTTNKPKAREMLDAIIRDYPNSEASRRAQALLEKLQSQPTKDE